MKDKHNVILILVSSKWSNFLLSGVVHHFTFSVREALYFLSRSSKFSQLYHHGDPSKSLQGFTLCFQLPFLLVILLFTGVLHQGTTWWFIKDLIPSRSVHQDSFQRSSSILLLAIRSAFLSSVSLEVVLCHSW